MKLKEILLMPNLKKEQSRQCLEATAKQLLHLGITPLLDGKFAAFVKGQDGCVLGELDAMLERCDAVMPIGGDGTILRCVDCAVKWDKPILGINTGRIGFLSQLEYAEISELSRLAQGRFTVEERMMLEAVMENEAGERESRCVLNDIVFNHKDNKLTDLVVHQGNRLIGRHRANGLIFATPTGSTAYSLSAGGCVADPTLSVLLLTAICPHSAYNRSIILPAEGEYTVGMENGNALYITFDGRHMVKLQGNRTVTVRKSDNKAKFMILDLRDFYSNLYDKLSLRR